MSLRTKAAELRRERKTLVEANHALLDTAEEAKRALSDEEQEQNDKRWTDIDGLQKRIEQLERQADAESGLEDIDDPGREPDDEGENRGQLNDAEKRAEIRRTVRAMDEDEYAALEEVRAFGNILGSRGAFDRAVEERALNITNDEEGGYLQPPQQFVERLIKAVDDQVFIRGLATTFSVPQAESLGVPSLDADPADPTWVAEASIGTEDTTMDFGKRALHPHPLAQFIKVSRTLLRKAAIGPEALVRERLAYKTGIVQEKAFLTGSGASQPLGVFTASSDGISTGRDVSTGNTTSSIGTDNLREVKYNQKGNYWPSLRWIFHRDAVKAISKLKDGNGQYLWQPGITTGDPDRLIGFPVIMSEYAPNTFTTGLYVGILGAFEHYWIADALSMEIQRLEELYAAANQVGFLIRSETDGLPVLEEAFTRVKLA